MNPEPDTLAVAHELASEHGMELEQAAVTVSAVVSLTAGIGAKVDRLVDAVGALRTELGVLGQKVDSLDTKVDSLDTKVDSLDTRVDGLMWRFVGVAIGLVSGVAVVFGIALAAVRLTA